MALFKKSREDKSIQPAQLKNSLNLTKLDGTAKGGIIFAIARETEIPIRFIGIGENIKDLQPFDASEFVAALFAGTYCRAN
jgi:fused signal recognition particle receptor